MRKPILAVALTVCIPVAVFGQRTRGGDPPSTPTSSAPAPSSGSSAKAPTARELADLNPASLLISKRKKASLADSTVTQLKAVEKTISDRNAPFFAKYDSVHMWTRPLASSSSSSSKPGFTPGDNQLATSSSSAAEQARMQASMRDLRGLMADYRERRKTDVADALNLVPESQKKAATDLLNQQDGDLDKLIGGRP